MNWIIGLIVLLLALPCQAQDLASLNVGVVGSGVVADSCTDHVVVIAPSAATNWTVGDGSGANYIGQTFVPGNNGTIKSIGVWVGDTSGTTQRLTLRWKHRTSGTDFDLSSYINSIVSGQLTSGAYIDFDVTDTVVSSADLYMIGVALTTGTAGDVHLQRDGINPYAGGLGINNSWQGARNSWVLDDNEDLAGEDMRMRFTICY